MRAPDGQRETSQSARTVAVIPARIGSTRIPEKPLVLLGGAPLVWRVYDRVRACSDLDAVYVATDDARVEDVVRSRGGRVIRIDAPCPSGTARVARAAAQIEASFVLNVQGDEPFIEPAALSLVVDRLRAGADIVTLAAPLPPDGLAERACVKVVADGAGHALYFSRAPIPGQQHVGVYGFRAAALQAVAPLPRSPAAIAEDLEQLTWLHHGWRVALCEVPEPAISIDTPADLERAAARLRAEL